MEEGQEHNNNELNKDVLQQEQTVTEEKRKFEPISQENIKEPKKKNKRGILIIILLLMAIVLGSIAYYYFAIHTNTKEIYKGFIKEGVASLTKQNEEVMALKSKVKFNIKLDLEEKLKSEIESKAESNQILDLINNTDIALEIQMDRKQNELLLKFDSDYKNEKLIEANMLIDAQKEKTYIQLEQFFDKVLEIEIEDKEVYESLKTLFESKEITLAEEKARVTITEILQKELSNAIKDEYCSKEKEEIEVESKKVNSYKYILKMTHEEMIKEITTIVENLKNDEEFLNCFKEKQNVQKRLENVLKELQASKPKDITYYVKVYRTGLTQKLVRVDFEIVSREATILTKIEKLKKGYKFSILNNNKVYFDGQIERTNDETNILSTRMNSQDIGTIEFKMEYSSNIIEKVDTIDVENVKTLEELTQQDIEKATERLEKSKLYEIIQKLIII